MKRIEVSNQGTTDQDVEEQRSEGTHRRKNQPSAVPDGNEIEVCIDVPGRDRNDPRQRSSREPTLDELDHLVLGCTLYAAIGSVVCVILVDDPPLVATPGHGLGKSAGCWLSLDRRSASAVIATPHADRCIGGRGVVQAAKDLF